ncbi:hypothetical protein Cfor_11783 [Coptotermes formosanus]|jgi:hypothetical protein|uniref:Reverse transcriptase domain-containing protein n=1 Tax=Coptotermes formosanus TaxID=36987 RepID=A0A6L2PYU2_COPFO|nr:hypothetical protein Cfor_11783 [Coptotermes formosanus]
MTGKNPKEWKNSIFVHIYKKDDKEKPENCRESRLINVCYKLYSNVLNEKFEAQAHLLLEGQHGFLKGRPCIKSFLVRNYFQKRREFNLGIHLAFLDYVEAFDKF